MEEGNREKLFFSTAEIARLLGVSRIAVFQKIKKGDINAKRVGRNYQIPREEVAHLLTGFLAEKRKKEIDASVDRVMREYGDVIRWLGKE